MILREVHMFKKYALLVLCSIAQYDSCQEKIGKSVFIDCGNELNPILKAMIKCEDGSHTQKECTDSIAALKAKGHSLYSSLRIGSDRHSYYSDDSKGSYQLEMNPGEFAVMAGMPRALNGLISNGYSVVNVSANTEPKLNLLAMLAYVSNNKIIIPPQIEPSFSLNQEVALKMVDILAERISAKGPVSCDSFDFKIQLSSGQVKCVNTLPQLCQKHPSIVCDYIKTKS